MLTPFAGKSLGPNASRFDSANISIEGNPGATGDAGEAWPERATPGKMVAAKGNTGEPGAAGGGGELHVQLFYDRTAKYIIAQRLLQGPDRSWTVPFGAPVHVSPGQLLLLEAVGGVGGTGGTGGPGQPGCVGTSGTDTSYYNVGTAGTDGGKGGAGGDGGPGGPGGPGGRIVIHVAAEDADLLACVCCNVEGGQGGRGGAPGNPGEGGPFGKGGAAFDQLVLRNERSLEPGPTGDWRVIVQRNDHTPACSDGEPGKPGEAGASGRGGSDGKEGSVYVQIDDELQCSRSRAEPDAWLSEPYIVVSTCDVHAVQNDGVFEPGETVRISNVGIVNGGKIPLPGHLSRIGVEFAKSSPIVWGSLVPDALEPDAPCVVKDTFEVQIPASLAGCGSGKAYEGLFELKVHGELARVGRRGRPYATSLPISYPVMMGQFDGKLELVAGAESRVSVKVTNKSSVPLGRDHGRSVAVRFTFAGNGSGVTLVGQNANDRSNTRTEIKSLAPGESTNVSIGLKIDSQAAPKLVGPLEARLSLQQLPLGALTSNLEIQVVSTQISIQHPYVGPEEPGFGAVKAHQPNVLFVLNSSLGGDAYAYLQAAVKEVAGVMRPAVWDVSVHGHCNFLRGDPSLAEQWQGKTVVIVDEPVGHPTRITSARNALDSAGGTLALVNCDSFVMAQQKYGITFLVLGGDETKNWLFLKQCISQRANRNTEPSRFSSTGELLDVANNAVLGSVDWQVGDSCVASVASARRRIPTEEVFDREVEKIAERINLFDPAGSFLIVKDYNPAFIREPGRNRWEFGTIELVRVPAVHHQAVTLRWPQKNLSYPNIAHEAFTLLLLKCVRDPMGEVRAAIDEGWIGRVLKVLPSVTPLLIGEQCRTPAYSRSLPLLREYLTVLLKPELANSELIRREVAHALGELATAAGVSFSLGEKMPWSRLFHSKRALETRRLIKKAIADCGAGWFARRELRKIIRERIKHFAQNGPVYFRENGPLAYTVGGNFLAQRGLRPQDVPAMQGVRIITAAQFQLFLQSHKTVEPCRLRAERNFSALRANA